MMISKKDALFKTRPNKPAKWMSRYVGLVCFQSLVGLRLVLVVCLMSRCKRWKKVNGNWDFININRYSTFHTGKPGNFNSLREVIWNILWHCYLEIDWRWESVPKKNVMVISILQMTFIGHVFEAPGLYQQILL